MSGLDLLKAYEQMLLIRRFEERAAQLYGRGLIGGFCHLYIGQEAVVVGIQAALTPEDAVITSYRDHGHMLACGMDPKGVMAELTGREGGYSKGKGGSMHMFSREKKFFGGHGIVGAQVPLGTGIAFAQKYLGEKGLCATYMGDGAFNQGQVYEAFNMAALWNLPVLYVVENNRYAMGTSVSRHSATAQLYTRGVAFGLTGASVDGMDVNLVYTAAKKAVSHIRSGKGPYLLEVETYRYRGHSMSDPATYRTKEEVDDIRTHHDPLLRAYAALVASGVPESVFEEMEARVKTEMLAAVEFAETSPEPPMYELYTDVLVGEGA